MRVTMTAMAESESDGTPKQEIDQYHTGRESWFVEAPNARLSRTTPSAR